MINRSTQIAKTIHQFWLSAGISPHIIFAFNIFINCIAVLQFRSQLHQSFNQQINRFNFQINVMKILEDKVATDFCRCGKKSLKKKIRLAMIRPLTSAKPVQHSNQLSLNWYLYLMDWYLMSNPGLVWNLNSDTTHQKKIQFNSFCPQFGKWMDYPIRE